MSPTSVLLSLLILSLSPVCAIAQELPGQEELFEEANPQTHAGLLGKRYAQVMYRQFHLYDDPLKIFDDSLQGFDARLNVPLWHSPEPRGLGIDSYGGYGRLGLGGTTFIGPPLNTSATLHSSNEAYYGGLVAHASIFEKVRPFTQLGVAFTDSRAALSLGGQFADKFVDHDTRMQMVLGAEADLASFAAVRCAFNIATKERFGDSVFSTELILWAHKPVFLRGGVLAPLNGEALGATVGGVIQF